MTNRLLADVGPNPLAADFVSTFLRFDGFSAGTKLQVRGDVYVSESYTQQPNRQTRSESKRVMKEISVHVINIQSYLQVFQIRFGRHLVGGGPVGISLLNSDTAAEAIVRSITITRNVNGSIFVIIFFFLLSSS